MECAAGISATFSQPPPACVSPDLNSLHTTCEETKGHTGRWVAWPRRVRCSPRAVVPPGSCSHSLPIPMGGAHSLVLSLFLSQGEASDQGAGGAERGRGPGCRVPAGRAGGQGGAGGAAAACCLGAPGPRRREGRPVRVSSGSGGPGRRRRLSTHTWFFSGSKIWRTSSSRCSSPGTRSRRPSGGSECFWPRVDGVDARECPAPPGEVEKPRSPCCVFKFASRTS